MWYFGEDCPDRTEEVLYSITTVGCPFSLLNFRSKTKTVSLVFRLVLLFAKLKIIISSLRFVSLHFASLFGIDFSLRFASFCFIFVASNFSFFVWNQIYAGFNSV